MNTQSQSAYPTREQMCQQWQQLATEISDTRSKSEHYPDPSFTKKGGSLVILGSGIQSLGFSMNDVQVIENADVVFYCVADPATIVWLKKLRPDAYDLYTLYDDNKVRYHTYMQMTESMLHCLRQGKNVVAIFYGHPGIFVLSTHRAVAIARNEGLNAEMRAGVSALDCLCADLGVDPSHPGMVTYEATDMLIRLRKPDTSLHVILWQVGLIAEMGYRRTGFINNNFITLIEYLEDFYGSDHEVVHYIASRYPTLPSKIEKYTLGQLKDPRIRTRISGLSTFYIAPKDARQADLDMCIKLGLAKPGQTVKPTGTLREIDKYDYREMKAIDLFEHFKVPEEYQYQENTAVAQFIVQLSTDADLQKRYASDPAAVLADDMFSHLSQRDKDALLSRDEGRIQIAAKGLRVRSSEQERFVSKVYGSQKLAREILDTVNAYKLTGELETKLEALATKNGFNLRWKNIPSAIENVCASSLLPWTSVYADAVSKHSLILAGNSHVNNKALIFLDTVPIRNFTFNNYTLLWKQEDGNATNGWLQFSMPEQNRAAYQRVVSGKIWTGQEPSGANFNASELLIEKGFVAPSNDLNGTYSFRFAQGEWKSDTLVLKDNQLALFGSAIETGTPKNGHIRFTASNGAVAQGNLTFMQDPFTGLPTFFGTLYFASAPQKPVVCYGVKNQSEPPASAAVVPGFPEWVLHNIRTVNKQYQASGGLLIYNQYVKVRLTGIILSKINNKKFFTKTK